MMLPVFNRVSHSRGGRTAGGGPNTDGILTGFLQMNAEGLNYNSTPQAQISIMFSCMKLVFKPCVSCHFSLV